MTNAIRRAEALYAFLVHRGSDEKRAEVVAGFVATIRQATRSRFKGFSTREVS